MDTTEDIKLLVDGQVSLSENILNKIEYIIKHSYYMTTTSYLKKIEGSLPTIMPKNTFFRVFNEVIVSMGTSLELSYNNYKEGTDEHLNHIQKEEYRLLFKIIKYILKSRNMDVTTNEQIVSAISKIGSITSSIQSLSNLGNISEIIDLFYEYSQNNYKVNLYNDLIWEKEKILDEMTFYRSSKDIETFSLLFDKYINDCNLDDAIKLVEQAQKKLIEEWKSYCTEMEDMTDDNFRFIGHSVKTVDFTEFHTQYISCSLYTNKLNDTFNKPVGFIMDSEDILCASAEDCMTDNSAKNDNQIVCSVVNPIRHPHKIMEHNLKRKNLTLNGAKKTTVYNEVVEKRFNPKGIFCFTNGLLSYDVNCEYARKLQENFPHLKIKFLNTYKNKRGIDLIEERLEILNSLDRAITGSDHHKIYEDALPRYDYFFKKYDELILRENYNENDIMSIFLRNKKLLLVSDASKLNLEEYTKEEIKFIIGESWEFSVNHILDGKTSLSRMNLLYEKLRNRTINLDDYYPGFEGFLEIIYKYKITDVMLTALSVEVPLDFLKASDILVTIIKKDIQDKKQNIERDTSNTEEKIQTLISLFKESERLHNKYVRAQKICDNSNWQSIIQVDALTVEEQQKTLKIDLEKLARDKKKYLELLKKLKADRENLEVGSIPNTEDYRTFRIEYDNLLNQRELLKKHTLLNVFKIRTINKKIGKLESTLHRLEDECENKNKAMISSLDEEILSAESILTTFDGREEELLRRDSVLRDEKQNLVNKMRGYFDVDNVEAMNKIITEAFNFISSYDYGNEIIYEDLKSQMLDLEAEKKMNTSTLNNLAEQEHEISELAKKI